MTKDKQGVNACSSKPKKNYETDSPSIIPELQNIKFNFNGV